MPAPKGHKRYGGRSKGTLNKNKKALRDVAASRNVDPFEVLCLFAAGDADALGLPEVPPELRLQAAKEACKYLHPQLKAVDHTGVLSAVYRELEEASNDELDAILIEETTTKN